MHYIHDVYSMCIVYDYISHALFIYGIYTCYMCINIYIYTKYSCINICVKCIIYVYIYIMFIIRITCHIIYIHRSINN